MRVITTILFLFLVTLQVTYGQKNVNLSHQNLQYLPATLKANLEVETLVLLGNPLISLPDWLPQLPALKTIILNEVTTLPIAKTFEVLSKCPALTTLSWTEGKLVYVPVSLNDFPILKNLNLANNGIVELPLLKRDNVIEFFDISKNLIDTLGPSILHFKELQHFIFSFNPGGNNENNFHLLKDLKKLNTLSVKGTSTIPYKLFEISQLVTIDLSQSKFEGFPDNAPELPNLQSLNLFNCKHISMPAIVEKLSSFNGLNKLTIGGDSLKKIPYNIFKLSALKYLKVVQSCLEYVPSSIKKLPISTLILDRCGLTDDTKFFTTVASIPTLKKLSIFNLSSPNVDLKNFGTLDSLDIRNCQLSYLPPSLKNISWIDIRGNNIPFDNIKHFTGTLVGKNKLMKVPFVSPQASKIYSGAPVYRKTIYTHIGDLFNYKGVTVQIPAHAFLDNNSKVIDGEVVVVLSVVNRANNFAASSKGFIDDKKNVINPRKVVYIDAYQLKENKEKESVFINQKEPLSITYVSSSQDRINAYYYSDKKEHWKTLTTIRNYCPKKQQTTKKKSFKSTVYKALNTYPTPSFQVRNSKVHMRLKRNKRRNTLKLEITPEYGYKENFFQLFGSKIKGYPELKVFKDIKWNFVGDSIEQVLEQLYFLSEQAKSEKLKRKSNFYFYVFDITNITITPHTSKDNYVMSIVQGKDTLKLEVLPNLKFLNAKKVQKWHRKKYKKYSKKLSERLVYWKKLDSLHLNHFSSFEKKLEKFRTKVIESEKDIKPSKKEIFNNEHQYSVSVTKKGNYLFGDHLFVDYGKVMSLKLSISGKTHHGKTVLIRNPKKNYTYWQNTKKVMLNFSGDNYIYSKVGDQIYVGKYIYNKTVKLTKFKSK